MVSCMTTQDLEVTTTVRRIHSFTSIVRNSLNFCRLFSINDSTLSNTNRNFLSWELLIPIFLEPSSKFYLYSTKLMIWSISKLGCKPALSWICYLATSLLDFNCNFWIICFISTSIVWTPLAWIKTTPAKKNLRFTKKWTALRTILDFPIPGNPNKHVNLLPDAILETNYTKSLSLPTRFDIGEYIYSTSTLSDRSTS